jgi:uncharacterized membrane protein
MYIFASLTFFIDQCSLVEESFVEQMKLTMLSGFPLAAAWRILGLILEQKVPRCSVAAML